jgi:N-acyl-D-amino-acid deacylase
MPAAGPRQPGAEVGVLDVLIANGLVIDGTGSAGFYAAVGIEGDTVRILRGDVSNIQAARTIDATGRVV